MRILEHFLKFSEVALEPSGPIQYGFHSLWGKLGAVLGLFTLILRCLGGGNHKEAELVALAFCLSALLRPQVAS